jgi:hypothetical protein
MHSQHNKISVDTLITTAPKTPLLVNRRDFVKRNLTLSSLNLQAVRLRLSGNLIPILVIRIGMENAKTSV